MKNNLVGKTKFMVGASLNIMRMNYSRTSQHVSQAYNSVWGSYEAKLNKSSTLDEWLLASGADAEARFYRINNKLEHRYFDCGAYYRKMVFDAIMENFPNAQSVTEFGCGLGNNLLALKSKYPHLKCYGYELAEEGVRIAQKAAEKFRLDVKYSQLNYVESPAEDYVFPDTDVAYTCFSLEQIPVENKKALSNILNRTKLGSVHLEPVPENYPLFDLKSLLGRLYSKKIDYLKGFPKSVQAMSLAHHQYKVLGTAHNPFMAPSLYVLKKGPSTLRH